MLNQTVLTCQLAFAREDQKEIEKAPDGQFPFLLLFCVKMFTLFFHFKESDLHCVPNSL